MRDKIFLIVRLAFFTKALLGCWTILGKIEILPGFVGNLHQLLSDRNFNLLGIAGQFVVTDATTVAV